MSMQPRAVVLLGTQRWDPSLGTTVAAVGVQGKIAVVTAGWQEREAEDDDLEAHLAKLGGHTINLRLHARGEEVFASDPALANALHERQQRLRLHQDCYRIRLEAALEADRIIHQRQAAPSILEEEMEASINAIRALDEWHLEHCLEVHAEFEQKWKIGERPAVAKHREEVAAIVAGCNAIAIAGGHVATLVNRLALFAIGKLVGGRAVFAWAAGAMAISDRIVLFHDDPPQGPGASEILDAGIGLASGVVVLPEPERRIRFDRPDTIQRKVHRFAPALCLALPASAYVTWSEGKAVSASGALELCADGTHTAFDPAMHRGTA
jgi:hypothetical protein